MTSKDCNHSTLYQDLADEIREAIETGVYDASERLPSVRQMSLLKGVSINTVLRAYGVLEETGLVSAEDRMGYFVRAPAHQAEQRLGEPWQGTFEDLMPALLTHSGSTRLINMALSQPEPDLVPHQVIAKEMRTILRNRTSEVFNYTSPAGLIELRRQIVRHLSTVGLATRFDQLVITNGCQEALSLAIQTLTREQDIVAVQSPCYSGVLHLLTTTGRRVIEIPSENGGGIRQDLLERAAKTYRIAACYVMSGVANPAGGTMDPESKQSLCDLANNYGFPVVEDYSNGELPACTEAKRPIKAYDHTGNVVLCGSFSKTLSPGLCVGWLDSGQHHADALKLKYGASLNVAPLNQYTVASLLAKGLYRRHLAKVASTRAQTLRLLHHAICSSLPIKAPPSLPIAGSHLWVELADPLDAHEVAQRCEEYGILFAPGRIFSLSGAYDHFLRIGWGGEWAPRCAAAITRAGAIMRAQATADDATQP